MFARGGFNTFSVVPELLGSLSDHSALFVVLPWSIPCNATAAFGERTVYRWVDGTRLTDYSCSWRAWEKHTDSDDFVTPLTAIVDAPHADVDALALAVESFIL
jgi:hypothetical protein